MKRILIIAIVILTCSSCASIMNSATDKLTITSTKPSIIVVSLDTVAKNSTEATISVQRQKDDLEIKVISDSLSKPLAISSRNSLAYFSNIICNYGIGMLIDRKKTKRYSYPRWIYINPNDTSTNYLTYDPRSRKGNLDLHLSLPHINTFLLKPDDETDKKSNTGFWGIKIGLDYYYSSNQFFSLTASGVSDFFVPVPAAVDISGEYELMSSAYFGLSNNQRLGPFLVGYGISFSKNTWDLRYYDRFGPPPPTRAPIKKSNNAFGLIFPLSYHLGKYLFLGTVYRPTIFRLSSIDPIEYEHLISIDFGWKIKLKK